MKDFFNLCFQFLSMFVLIHHLFFNVKNFFNLFLLKRKSSKDFLLELILYLFYTFV
nr:MAG TPA: hypothetical protein [Caudoviricetes sp.]